MYESDLTKFMKKYMAEHPEEVESQRKGRAIWSSYAGYAAWHVEGGKGEKAKVVKFQLRPDPLAK